MYLIDIFISRQKRTELSQSVARIVITAVVLLFLVIYSIYGQPYPNQPFALWLVIGFFIHALVLHAAIRLKPRASVWRRSLAMAVDLGALSFGFYLTGAFGGFLYPILLWVIVGNGLRFGVRYLLAATAIAAAGLATALINSDYWGQHISLGAGLMIGITILPMFYAIILRELETSNKELKKQIDVTAYAATHDSLTELPNRFVFMDRLAQAVERSKRNKSRFAVLFIDLDRFNHINDTHGHIAGDEVLRSIASRLVNVLRGTDSAARLGSDEFVLLLNDLESRYNARQAGERIIQIFSTPLNISGHELTVTASVGISIFPDDAEDVDSLIHYSDTAMYRAKKRGGNAFQSFSYIKEVQA